MTFFATVCTKLLTMVYMKPERTPWSMKPKRTEKQHNSNIQYAKEREMQCLNAHRVALLVCCAVFQNGGLLHINASIHSIGTNSYIFFINVIRCSDAISAVKKPKAMKPKERTGYFPGKKTQLAQLVNSLRLHAL